MLSPKIDLKGEIYKLGFTGEEPEAEKIIEIGKKRVREFVEWLKKVQ